MMVSTVEPGRMEKKNSNIHTQTSYLVMALSLCLFFSLLWLFYLWKLFGLRKGSVKKKI